MTVAVVRLGALGDVVLASAVTAAASEPVVFVTRPRWIEVARRFRGVSRVVAWESAAQVVRDVGPARWVDLDAGTRTLALDIMTGSSRYRKQSVRRRLLAWWGIGPGRVPVIEGYGRAAGFGPAPLPWLDVPRLSPSSLLLLPGAAFAEKQWSVAGFVAVGRRWGGPVDVCGGPGEEGLCGAIAAEIPGARAWSGAGFGPVFDAIGRARAAIGADSGLTHLAAAAGVPTVVTFGPTSPLDGFFPHAVAVERELACRPCALHRVDGCARGDLACQDLAPQQVFSALEQALRGATGAASCTGS